jgi:hypothetical protein
MVTMGIGILFLILSLLVRHRAANWALASLTLAAFVISAIGFIVRTEVLSLTLKSAIPFGCVTAVWVCWLVYLSRQPY